MEYLNKLLDELNEYWDILKDSRVKGEHPRCGEIQEELIDIFNNMSDTELISFLSDFDEDKLEQIAYPLDEILDNHSCVEPYIQY